MQNGRARRSTRVLVAAAGSLAVVLTLLPGVSQADPDSTDQTSRQPTIAQVRDRIDHLRRQAEDASEAANGLRDQMKGIKLRLKSLRTDIARQNHKAAVLESEIGDFASAQYRSGGTGVTAQLLASSAPDDFLDRMAISESVQAQQGRAVIELAAVQKVLTEKRSAQEATLDRLTDAKAKAAEKHADAERKVSEQKDLLQRLTEAERRRLAALERQRQARIAAEVARANRSQERADTAAADNADSTNTDSTNTDSTGGDDSTRGGSTSTGGTENEPPPAPSSDGAPSQRALTALAYAKAQLGKPYVFGAAGPNAFDCSGLTMMAWRAAGVSLPHLVSAQYNAVAHKVSISELEPGDLVMFYNMGHVGIYAGNGMVIHAPRPGKTVEYLPMKYMPFAGAVRPG